jgi:hypothetical protein
MRREVWLEAFLAGVSLLLGVDGNLMFVQIGFLGKGLVAAWHFAYKGSLSGMHSQMVEKVMKLPKILFTPFVIATEDLHIPLGLWVLVLEDSELLGGGHLVLNLDRREVEVRSLYLLNLGIMCDELPYFLI